jgi:demethylmenaquinone methyltransferase / 2-methoxy-6-polyprenyl-1,4-benzoquinol methylase
MSEQVHQMFSTIAAKYDVTNDALSFGIHRLWRRRAVKVSGAKPGDTILDCATGTGDLALAFKRVVGEKGSVLGTDFNADMLKTAPQKAERQHLAVEFEVADAMHLSYANDRFDVASISFGIRNVDDPRVALKELARVVKTGGRVVILEFGQPQGAFGTFYRTYAKHVMPRIGGFMSGNRAAYEYLPQTAAAFPCGAAFTDMMDQTESFSKTQNIPLLNGLAHIYVGTVK